MCQGVAQLHRGQSPQYVMLEAATTLRSAARRREGENGFIVCGDRVGGAQRSNGYVVQAGYTRKRFLNEDLTAKRFRERHPAAWGAGRGERT